MYTTLSEHYRQKFGCKVYKLALDAGFTCPNRDGTLGTGGCIFCSAAGGGDFAERGTDIPSQLEKAKSRVAFKNKKGKYMAYFQSFTNTYAAPETLRRLYLQAIEPEEVVGLSIGTRPDCLGEDVMAVLKEIHAIKPVSVELGLQTVHEATARYLRRGYEAPIYYDAVRRLREAGIDVVTHIILGLPGETTQMAMETTRRAIAAGTNGIKFHLLHVLRGSDLEKDYAQGKFACLSLEAYGEMLDSCLSLLNESIVVHRLTGDGPKKDLISPQWSADKKQVLRYLQENLKNIR